jgi:hypothetical protein
MLAPLLIGALSASGGSYLAMRDTIIRHEFRIQSLESRADISERVINGHVSTYSGDQVDAQWVKRCVSTLEQKVNNIETLAQQIKAEQERKRATEIKR